MTDFPAGRRQAVSRASLLGGRRFFGLGLMDESVGEIAVVRLRVKCATGACLFPMSWSHMEIRLLGYMYTHARSVIVTILSLDACTKPR